MTGEAILIVGMHRSGTSALAGVLSRLGVKLGENLIPALPGANERGFWEHEEIVGVHDRILAALGYAWDDVRPLPDDWWRDRRVRPFRDQILQIVRRDFSGATLWGFKDPRMCRLLSLWFGILKEVSCVPCVIHIHRHPLEVAESLQRRDGFSHAKGMFLWLDHNLSAERLSRGHRRVFVGYDELLADARSVVGRIRLELDCAWPRPLDGSMEEVAEFLAPQLRHHVAKLDPSEVNDALVSDTYEAMCAATRGESPETRSAFESLDRRLQARVASFDPILVSHIGDVQRSRERLRTTLNHTYGTLSWRLTQPIRRVAQFAKTLFRAS